MAGQFGSELLDGPDDATDWTSLYAPAAPEYTPEPEYTSSVIGQAELPSAYVDTYGGPAQEAAPADIYSSVSAAEATPPIGPEPPGPIGGEAPPTLADPFQQMLYQPSADLYGGGEPAPPAPAPDFSLPGDFDWAPEPSSEDLAQSEGLNEFLFGDPRNVAPEWFIGRQQYNPQASYIDSWESPENALGNQYGERFSTVSGDDIGERTLEERPPPDERQDLSPFVEGPLAYNPGFQKWLGENFYRDRGYPGLTDYAEKVKYGPLPTGDEAGGLAYGSNYIELRGDYPFEWGGAHELAHAMEFGLSVPDEQLLEQMVVQVANAEIARNGPAAEGAKALLAKGDLMHVFTLIAEGNMPESRAVLEWVQQRLTTPDRGWQIAALKPQPNDSPPPAIDPNTGLPLDPSMYQQFGFGAEGGPLNNAGRSILSNPNFAASNAQFDYTTNPANREGPGILGGLQNIGRELIDPQNYWDFVTYQTPETRWLQEQGGNLGAAIGPNLPVIGPVIQAAGLAGNLGAPTPTSEDLGRLLGEGLTPSTGLDFATLGLGGLGIGYADDAARLGLRGYGANLDNLPDAITPLKNFLREESGMVKLPGSGDDAARFLDEAAKDPEWGRVIDAMKAQKLSPEEIVRSLGESPFTANTEVGRAAKNLLEGAPSPTAPITDLKSALRQDLGIADQPAVAREVGDTARPPRDPVEGASRQVFGAEGPNPVGAQPEGPAAYAWQQAPELEVSPKTLELIKAATENPSETTLVPLVEEIAGHRLGQLDLGLDVARTDGRGVWNRVIDEVIALAGLPRELKASFDNSIPGRTGLALAFRHPLEWADSWKTILPALRSEEGFRLFNQDAENWVTKWKQMAGENGVVHLNTIDRAAPGTERIAGFEADKGNTFVSKVSEKLGTAKFERSAVAFINHQRAKTMDTMFTSIRNTAEAQRQSLIRKGLSDPAAFLKIAKDEMDSYRNQAAIIDHWTGYGAAPLKGDIASRLFFSQRFMTSRIQAMADVVTEGVARGDMKAAQAAMENLVAFVGGTAAILFLAEEAIPGIDVEWNPNSTDFGKIRMGPARIDFGAGFLPLIRMLSQGLTGEKKVITGETLPIQKFDPESFKKESRVKATGNLALNFFRNKLDPVAGEIVNRGLAGRDVTGQAPTPLTSFATLENLFAPLMLQSVHDTLRNGGNPVSAGVTALSEFSGGSGATYGAGQAAQQDIARSRYGVDYSQIPSPYQAEINAGIPNIEIGERLAPWWNARNDGLKWYQSQIDGSENDPRIAAAAEATSYQDLGIRLQRVYEQEYGMTRTQAEKEVTKTIDSMVGDTIDQYRKDVAAADPGFAKAWLDAYDSRQTPYKPPVWVQKLANGE